MFDPRLLTAIVLSGGMSHRLGMMLSKPLLSLGGKLMLARVADVLKSLCAEEIVVVRPDQDDDVPDLGIALGMHVVTDIEGYSGPLSAMAAGLAQATTPLAFVIGADYPFLSRALVIEMTRRAHIGIDDDYSAVVLRHANRINPLHAIYPVNAWRDMTMQALDDGIRSPTSLIQNALEHDEVAVQIMTEDEAERIDPRLLSLFDIDTLDDLGIAKRIVDTRSFRVRADLRRGGV